MIPAWARPINAAERRMDAAYRRLVAAAERRGRAFRARHSRFFEGGGSFLIGENTSIVVKDEGTRIVIEKAGAKDSREDPFCLPLPEAVAIGVPPHWRFLNPGSRETRLVLQGGGRAVFGQNSSVAPGAFLTLNNKATFTLSGASYLGHDCNVNCRAGITIGPGTLIGQQSAMMDYDGHPVFAVGKAPATDAWAGSSAPITVGRGVWVGFRSIILKGSRIGDGSIIGAGSMVAGSIPALCAAAGNPARPVKKGVTWRRY